MERLHSFVIEDTPWIDERGWQGLNGKQPPKLNFEATPAPAQTTATPSPEQSDTLTTATPEQVPTSDNPASESRPVATGPRFFMTKSAMINQHKHEWPSIEQDMKDAKRNGLSNVAKAGTRGWHEDQAVEWARAKGRLKINHKHAASHGGLANSIFNSPTTQRHTLKG